MWPHTPQFFGSNDVLVHTAPQSSPPGHVSPPGPVVAVVAPWPPPPPAAPEPPVKSMPRSAAQPAQEPSAARRARPAKESLGEKDRAYFMVIRVIVVKISARTP